MHAVCLVILAGLPVAFADDVKTKDAIVGKWIGTDGETKDAVLEFTKDGKIKVMLKIADQSINVDGTYKFVDEDKAIEVEVSVGGQSNKEKNKVTLTKDMLTLTDPKGKEAKFKRAPK